MPLVDRAFRTLLTRMLRQGLITMAEAAELAGTSREAPRKWCLEAGFDPRLRRRAELRSMMVRANWGKVRERSLMRQRGSEAVDGSDAGQFVAAPKRRPSKEKVRAGLDAAVSAYLERGGKIYRGGC